jgi:predicted membrane protein
MHPRDCHCDHCFGRGVSPGLVSGLLITALGVILLLDRIGILEARDILRFWPVVLVVIGLLKLVSPGGGVGRTFGALLAIVGAALLLDKLGWAHVHFEDLWPLVLIALGLILLWRAVEWQRGGVLPPSSSLSRLREFVVFGGVERRVSAQDFEGGEVMVLFGGCEIDLTKAAMKGDQAIIEATAIFGGVELRVPEDWTVTLRGVGVFGGYSDHTRYPTPVAGAGRKELVVRGGAVFGGVDVKN